MKKVLAVLVTLVLAASFTACGGGDFDVDAINQQLKEMRITFPADGFTKVVGKEVVKLGDYATKLKGWLATMPAEYVLVVKGHASTTGEDTALGRSLNVKYSKQRGVNVYDKLVEEHGLDETKMVPVGMGTTEVDPELGEGENGLQRRTTFVFQLKEDTVPNIEGYNL